MVFLPIKKIRKKAKTLAAIAVLTLGVWATYLGTRAGSRPHTGHMSGPPSPQWASSLTSRSCASRDPPMHQPRHAETEPRHAEMGLHTPRRGHYEKGGSEAPRDACGATGCPPLTRWIAGFKGRANLHVFEDWCGSSVGQLRKNIHFPIFPHSRTFVSKLALTPKWKNYGLRIFGYLHPSTDGEFLFTIASDDNSEFWLSPDEKPANLALMAYVGKSGKEWTAPGEYTKFRTQASSPVRLSASSRYYFEVLHKQNDRGTDHVEVAWRLNVPSSTFAIIDARHLSLYTDDSSFKMNEVEYIPQSPASHVGGLEKASLPSHSAEMLHPDARDSLYLTPLVEATVLKGILPDCEYRPSYLLHGYDLDRYQGLQFVYLSYIYPNDYTRLTHMETENKCFYRENAYYLERFGFYRYMKMDAPEPRPGLAAQQPQRRDGENNGSLWEDRGSDGEAHADYGDDFDDYAFQRRRKLFGLDGNPSPAVPRGAVEDGGGGDGFAAPAAAEVGEPRRRFDDDDAAAAARPRGKSRDFREAVRGAGNESAEAAAALRAYKVAHNAKRRRKNVRNQRDAREDAVEKVGEAPEKNGTRPPQSANTTDGAVKPAASQAPASARSTTPPTHAADEEPRRNEASSRRMAKRKRDRNGDRRSEVIFANHAGRGQERGGGPGDKAAAAPGNNNNNNNDNNRGSRVEKNGKWSWAVEEEEEADWKRTFSIGETDFQFLRSDWIDLRCNVSGNLRLREEEAQAVANVMMENLGRVHPDLYELRRVVNAEKRRDRVKGNRYLLELELLHRPSGRLARLSHYVFAPLPARTSGQVADGGGVGGAANAPPLSLCLPRGFAWKPDVMVYFVVPVKNQGRWVQQFIWDMEALHRATGDQRFGVVIADYSSEDMDVEKALQRSSLPRYHYVKLQGNFERSAGLQAGVDVIKDPHSITFLCDLHLSFPHDIVDNIRKHCVEGHMAYAPIVMRLACGKSAREPDGYWEVNGFGLFGIYKSDFDGIGGMNTQEFRDHWGGEDWELLDRVLQAGLEVERLHLRNFYHYFHSRHGMWNQMKGAQDRE
ncbi:unnamed protein product [Lampetra fluviatilis]